MFLTMILALLIVLLALLGTLRGVRPGLVALAGTLLAAISAELWREPLEAWVQTTISAESPALPAFAILSLSFLLTIGVIGYAGAVLLPPDGPESYPGLLERVLGGLLGALNGAVISGFLLRYAVQIWAGPPVSGWLADASLARLLLAWLPLFMLGLLATTGGVILLRSARAGLQQSQGRRQSVAAATSLDEADRRLNEKIEQALRK